MAEKEGFEILNYMNEEELQFIIRVVHQLSKNVDVFNRENWAYINQVIQSKINFVGRKPNPVYLFLVTLEKNVSPFKNVSLYKFFKGTGYTEQTAEAISDTLNQVGEVIIKPASNILASNLFKIALPIGAILYLWKS